MSARGWNSVNFCDSDKACGMKVLTKIKLPSRKKISPYHLSGAFENNCAWNIENGCVCSVLKQIKRCLKRYFSDSDKACGMKVLAERKLLPCRKFSSFHLSIDFEKKTEVYLERCEVGTTCCFYCLQSEV